jgi:hypothetical protein
MIEKALAHVFFGEPWSRQQVMRILEVVLRRSLKKHGVTQLVGASPGLLAIFLLTPRLRTFVQGDGSLADVQRQYNADVEALLRHLADVVVTVRDEPLEARIRATDVAAIAKVLALVGDPVADVTHDQVAALYDWCADHPKTTAELAPLVAMGILDPPPPLSFGIVSTGFREKGKKGLAAEVVVLEPHVAQVTSTRPTDWRGVALTDPGRYVVTVASVGIATATTGNTAGQKLNVNLRFTFGLDCMPGGIEGYAITGMHHRRDAATGKWSYVDTRRPMSAALPVDLTYDADGTLTVAQAGQIFWVGRRHADDAHPMMAFKNATLTIRRVDPPAASVIAAPADGPPAYDDVVTTAPPPPASEPLVPSTLTPESLLAGVRAMAVAKSST